MKRFIWALSLAWAASLQAATYYVDSMWGGTTSGTASQPWKSVQWATVNTALASSDVTIYFPARVAGSDTHGTYDSNGDSTPDELDVSLKTDNSGHVLTIDGNTYFNSSESNPSWGVYSGTNRCWFKAIVSQDCSHVKHSNVTVHGCKCVQTGAAKVMSIAGDNWVVDGCELMANGASDGPALLIVPTADAAHQGSSCYTPALTNIFIKNNTIHDTFGEEIYVGGGGAPPLSDVGAGYPSHDSITISNNNIYAGATSGGQGDGIDVKGGITHLTIVANTIHDLTDPTSAGIRGIVIQGQQTGTNGVQVIERNTLYNVLGDDDGVVTLANSWGVPMGVTIRNNVIRNSTGGAGIVLYQSQDSVLIYNNTIYLNASVGIRGDAGSSYNIRGNLIIANNGGGSQATYSGTTTARDYNGYSTVPSGEGTNSFTTTAAANFVAAGSGDLHLISSAAAIAKGVNLSASFSNDRDNNVRGALWDAGAYQFVGALSAPGAPATLTATAGNAQVALVWPAPNADGGSAITNYILYRGYSSGAETKLADLGVVLSYLDTAVTNNVLNFYQVAAQNAIGVGSRSPEASATPSAPTVPSAPLNVVALPGNTVINVSWVAPASNGGTNIIFYQLKRGPSSGAETNYTTTGSTIYSDTAIVNGQLVFYKISAVNAIGEGPDSGEVFASGVAPTVTIKGKSGAGGKGRLK